jgi:hypothetical protein
MKRAPYPLPPPPPRGPPGFRPPAPRHAPIPPPAAGRGHVNHISAEEVHDAPGVVVGMLPVNSTPAVVLFDSGASHSFISKEFVEYNHIPSKLMHNPLIVQSPGLEKRAELECEGVKIEIGGEDFWATLIVLESTRLDVILGMDWLSKHDAIIDCPRRSVDR